MQRGRSREGAWIEIATYGYRRACYEVAPVRERGLKCTGKYDREGSASRRSREGAWIEIFKRLLILSTCFGRSREGAWIEMSIIGGALSNSAVAPVRERGLKSDMRGGGRCR